VSILDTTNAIADALRTIEGLSVYAEPDANPNLPAVFLEPPELGWTVMNSPRPDTATWQLLLVVPGNGYALAALEPLIEQVTDVLGANSRFAFTAGSPVSYRITGAALPAYSLTLEGGL
jgi:hypothetical protein